jgi:hypothetical protein
MDVVAILVVILVLLVFFKFVLPARSYYDEAPPLTKAVGTPCIGSPESVALYGNCGCDMDCAGHTQSGNYCSHKAKVCKPAKV